MAEVTELRNTIHDHVLVKNMNSGETVTAGGIVLRADNAKSHGVRPRWAEVFMVGPSQRDVKAGDWILIEHGRWTRKVIINNGSEEIHVQRVDHSCILLVADSAPSAEDQYIVSNC